MVVGVVTTFLTKAGSTTKIALSQASDTVSGFAETKDLDFGRSDVRKELFEAIVGITQYANLDNFQLVLKHRNNLDDALTVRAAITIKNSNPVRLGRPPQARYWRFRFQDLVITQPWKLSKLEVFGRLGSKRF